MTIDTIIAYRRETMSKKTFGDHLFGILDMWEESPQHFMDSMDMQRSELKRILKGVSLPNIDVLWKMSNVLGLSDSERLTFYEKASLSSKKVEYSQDITGNDSFGLFLYGVIDKGSICLDSFYQHTRTNKKVLKAFIKGGMVPSMGMLGIIADTLSLEDNDRLTLYDKLVT